MQWLFVISSLALVKEACCACLFNLDWDFPTLANAEQNKIKCYFRVNMKDYSDCLMELKLLEKPVIDIEELKKIFIDIQIKFYLKTRALAEALNSQEEMKFSFRNIRAIKRYFNETSPTIFMIHDYRDNYKSNPAITPSVASDYLAAQDLNIVMIDWEKLADPRKKRRNKEQPLTPDYALAKTNVRVIGEVVADLINEMRKENLLSFNCFIHIIGDGLAAHAAGIAGNVLQEKYSITPGRISGLDPSGVCFRNEDLKYRLDKSDALFVDITHSTAYISCAASYQQLVPISSRAASLFNKLCVTTPVPGTNETMGHVDYFYNGAYVPQPFCNKDLDQSQLGRCSHVYGGIFFKYVKSPFFLEACPEQGDCLRDVPMGYYAVPKYKGVFYVKTPSCNLLE